MYAVPIHDIPLALRSRFVNIFAFSIVYFTDKYLPAPPWAIAQLESLALSAIWRNSRRSVSKDRLQAMPLLGGFGMINLERQLEGQRAERFREILFDEDSKPHILEQRAAIKHIIDKATPQVQIPGHFRQQRQWSWRIVAVPHWPYPRFFSTKALTAFKETYINTLTIFQRAWIKHTVIGCARRPILEQRDKVYEDLTIDELERGMDALRQAKVEWFTEKVSQEKAFHHMSRSQARKNPPIVPKGNQCRNPLARPADWHNTWILLTRIDRILPREANTLRMLCLGSLHAADHFTHLDPQRPWASQSHCALCQNAEAPETMDHVFTCPVATELWAAAIPSRPAPTYNDLVSPINRHFSYTVIDAVYTHKIWSLRNKQRYSRHQPAPINFRHALKDLQKDIRAVRRRYL